MTTLLNDLRYTLRQLRRAPGFALTVLLTMALAIGATTAVYTVVYAALVAPLPYPHAEQLAVVWSRIGGQRNVISGGDFLDWQRQNRTFQQLVAWNEASFNLSTAAEPEQTPARLVTPGYFTLQGIPLQRGRDFLPDEGIPGRDHVAILTHKLWSRLGSDPALLGHTLQMNGTPYTVVGILPAGFADRLGPELMAPLALTPDQTGHDTHWLTAMGRLKPGVTLAQAQSDMDGIALRLAAAFPKTNTGFGVIVEPLQNDFLPRERVRNLWLLLGAVGFVLLITCANIANLMLARGASRQREIAIRSSLGATRRTIFGLSLLESLLLAASGGVLGIGLATALLRAIVSLVPEGTLPSEANFQLDLHVLLLSLAATTAAGLLFGAAPAWYATRVNPADALKAGGRTTPSSGSFRLRRALIISEFALTLSLLAGAGLAIRSFYKLTQSDLGVRTDHVLVFQLNQPATRFTHPGEIQVYYDRVLASVRALPGVATASLTTGLPLRYVSYGMYFSLVGGPAYADPSQRPDTRFQSISPGYLATFGTPLLQGRSFTDQDSATSVPVAVVNRAFADHFLKNLDPLKQRVRIEQILPGSSHLGPEIEWQIVGVTANVLAGDLREPKPEVDVPFAQSLSDNVTIGLRTAVDPATIARSAANAVHAVDPTIALAHVRTLDQIKAEALGEDLFTVRLFTAFAAAALLLAAIGIYGLISYTVAQRTQEIGLRLALGSSRQSIATLILRDALRLALPGLGLGLLGAYAVGRLMQSTLYGVGSLDPAATFTVTTLLLAVALLAALLPARRAATVNPIIALRAE